MQNCNSFGVLLALSHSDSDIDLQHVHKRKIIIQKLWVIHPFYKNACFNNLAVVYICTRDDFLSILSIQLTCPCIV